MNKNQSKIKVFTDLVTWQEGHKLVLSIYALTKKFPNAEKFGLSSQIQRAAVSITSNIAEGFSRKSNAEKIQFYYISLSSLTEVQNQLLIARDLKYINVELAKETYICSVRVQQLLNALITSTKKGKNYSSKFKTQNSKLETLLILLTLTLAGFANPCFVSASDHTSLGVDPIKIKMDLIAEETQTREIKVYNLNNQDQDYLVYYEKFAIIGEEGKIRFFKETEEEIAITFSETAVTIPANSSTTITAKFYGEKTLPRSIYYYTVFIEPIPTDTTATNSGSFITGKIGILTYVNFVHSKEDLNELIKSGQIVEFSIQNEWNLRSPVEFAARINNTGMLPYDACGTIEIKTQKGKVVETIVLDKMTVLPGTIRIPESRQLAPQWNFKYLIGKYEAKLEIKSKDEAVQMTDIISFYVIPLRLLLILLATSTLLCSIVIILKRSGQKITKS